ncbi:MAG: membrane-bound O-acyltransferase family protein [Pedosphaera sp. Tous-C6FEB]|nr:MAG: membrane-bound O-acyltransferase family protein [Pedosphaera sp. Tous-C6FEB]
MLFSSLEFIFVFLPLTWLAFYAASRWLGLGWALSTLAVASVVFYGWWRPEGLVLFLGSVTANYGVARLINGPDRRSRGWFYAGLVLNLSVLGFCKYGAFASPLFVQAGWLEEPMLQDTLPLGISFFTFTQIAYLVDRSRGEAAPPSFLRYLLFVSFFPHLIAGPVLHHRLIMPQFERLAFSWGSGSTGLFLFAVGLAKKVGIADPVGRMVDYGFGHAAEMEPAHAWVVLTGYAVQLYFDFSGYSDMAVGLGKMCGVEMPWNFDSPYRCTSLAEFWRRWHMTLSNFFKDYVYIPLGGSKCGTARHCGNLLLTMGLAGLWHGAGWTFILWGLLHGVGLVVNHLWRTRFAPLPRLIGWGLTMALVLPGWVLFRASDLTQAGLIYRRLGGEAAPRATGDMSVMVEHSGAFLVLGLILAFACPNAKRLAERHQPTARWTIATAALLFLSVVLILANQQQPEFLYFNF